jgi:hypothetical protein
MKKIGLYVLIIVLSVGSTAMVQSAMRRQSLNSDGSALTATNGAFRDGLYLGKLAAKNGEEPRISTGRWVQDEDRSAFREGYIRGFHQTLVDLGVAED